MSDPVLDFYERLADDYHLLFADWRRSIVKQAQALDPVIRAEVGDEHDPISLLDCSCGIGTQAIGLSLNGYRVHATDLSAAAVARAAKEAHAMGAQITTGVADLRQLDEKVLGTFDVVISCDNALPHLLTDEDLGKATRAIASKLIRGGVFVASTRDYDAVLLERPRSTAPVVVDDAKGRRLIFQVWDWTADAPIYQLSQFIVRQVGERWVTAVHRSVYRALTRSAVNDALTAAGFEKLRWLMPAETGYFQPLVVARRA